MKTVAVMQPYLFPYIGYWQLIANVDTFVILDDVNYIKRGYINRNNILVDGEKYMFTVPVKKPSQNVLIKDTKLAFDEKEKKRILKMLQMSYSKAPEFEKVFKVLQDIIMYDEDDITEYIKNSIKKIADYLGINTEIIKSSDIEKPEELKGQERIIYICKQLGADRYINPCGGVDLYSKERFAEENMELCFLNTDWDKCKYQQYGDSFIQGLSIIDVMMFNKTNQILDMLMAINL